MKCKILLFVLAAIAAMSATVWSADISGDWKVEGARQDPKITRALYELKVDGSKLTGSVFGYDEDERPILDGKVTDDKIFFTLKEYAGNRAIECRYEGKVSGDTIKFIVNCVGVGRYWKFTAKKVNP